MDFDAIVIGGGHAGIEAALALARLKFKTLLITQSLDAIGRLSCNPAIGGLAKGNLVREIDALGGQMARLIDQTMIQFRMLNRSKGPAVQSPRAQADKAAYSLLAKHTLEKESYLSVFQDTVCDLLVSKDKRRIEGVITERGKGLSSRTVVLTTGTFMEATIFIGEFCQASGRLGEPAAQGLGQALRRLGFTVGRLKTGTPARVLRRSLRPERMEIQEGEAISLPFSFAYHSIQRPSLQCYITYTNEKTHQIIRDNIHRSPLYGGKIKGRGPRYCPSIEDKVMRFPDRSRHQIFVEPEGLNTEEMYLNGISSSLPEDVQEAFLRTVAGLEDIVITRPGYAVEYDYLNPIQLYPSLETKRLEGLFVAGQTNGTSGYEEAAGQGLMAGINAALKMQGKPPLILSRAEAYLGVLIDDLVTMGTEEPYRLFTSRAEHRLALRHDTADRRLFNYAEKIGLLDEGVKQHFYHKQQQLAEIKELLAKRKLSLNDTAKLSQFQGQEGKSLLELLKNPAFNLNICLQLAEGLKAYPAQYIEQVFLDVKYEGYINKQMQAVERLKKMERMILPKDLNYDQIEGMSRESREKLNKVKPVSLGQAARVPGVRSSDIAVLMVWLTKTNRTKES